MTSKPLSKVVLCGAIFLFYQYGYHFILQFVREEMQKSFPHETSTLLIAICYLLTCPLTIFWFERKVVPSKYQGRVVLIAGLVYAILLMLGVQAYHLEVQTNVKYLQVVIVSIATPLYFLLLYAFISYVKRSPSPLVQGISLSLVQSFDLIMISIENILGQSETVLLDVCFFYAIIIQIIASPLFAYLMKCDQSEKHTDKSTNNLCFFVGSLVMSTFFMGSLQNDYGSLYIAQIADARAYYVIQSVFQFLTPLLIAITSYKCQNLMKGWLLLALVTGAYYLALKILYNSTNFYVLSVFMGGLISYQLSFAIQGEGYQLSYHLLSLSLSHGLFEVYQLFLPLFQEGLIGSLAIIGLTLVIILIFGSKTNKPKQE